MECILHIRYPSCQLRARLCGDDTLLTALKQSNDNDDKLLQLVQSSTHNLMGSFRDKTELLIKCSNDIKLLIREGYDVKIAKETAEKFFGKKKISFIAIDGTESQDQELDMLIFYAGAFGYIGQLNL